MNKDSKKESFVKQAAVLAGASLFVRLMGFLYRLPLTRLIGDEFNAFYALSYQVYVVVLNLTSAFMITAISRLTSERIAQNRYRDAHSLFKTAMVFSLCLGILGFLAMFLGADAIAHYMQSDSHGMAAGAIRAISPSVFIVSMLTVFRGYFQGMKNAAPTAISQIVEQIIKITFSLWLAFLFFDASNISGTVHLSAAGATAGTAIAALAALTVILIIYAKNAKKIKHRVMEDTNENREKYSTQIFSIIKTGLPIMTGLFVYSFIGLLDIRMANNRLDASGAFSHHEINILVGQFTGKFVLLTTLPIALSMALSAAIIPEITAAHVTNEKEAVRQKTNLALRLSMLLSFPSAIGLAVLADPIIALLFPRHPGGGWLLQFGAICIVFLSLVHVVTGVLHGVGYMKIPIIGVICGVIVKVPLNHFLISIPEINILGAVISTIACYAVAAAVNLFFLKRFTGIFPDYVSTFLKPLIASAGMGFICFVVYYIMRMFTGNLIASIAAIVVSVFAYGIIILLIKGLGKRELQMLGLKRFL